MTSAYYAHDMTCYTCASVNAAFQIAYKPHWRAGLPNHIHMNWQPSWPYAKIIPKINTHPPTQPAMLRTAGCSLPLCCPNLLMRIAKQSSEKLVHVTRSVVKNVRVDIQGQASAAVTTMGRIETSKMLMATHTASGQQCAH